MSAKKESKSGHIRSPKEIARDLRISLSAIIRKKEKTTDFYPSTEEYIRSAREIVDKKNQKLKTLALAGLASGSLAVYIYYKVRKDKTIKEIQYIGLKEDDNNPPKLLIQLAKGGIGNANIVFPENHDNLFSDD